MKLEEKIVSVIINDMCYRKGIGDEWGNIDDSTQDDIRDDWARLVKDIIDKEFGNK